MLEKARIESIMRRYRCSQEDAWLYLDMRDEGYSRYQAAVLAGIADPHEDSSAQGGSDGHAA